MRTLFLIIASSLFLACGKHDKKNNTPHPGPSNPTAPSVEPDPYNLVEREAGVVQKYKAIGVTFEFWSGQDANLRDIEINQLQQLLPEIEKRTSFVRKLEVSGYKMHWYENSNYSANMKASS